MVGDGRGGPAGEDASCEARGGVLRALIGVISWVLRAVGTSETGLSV